MRVLDLTRALAGPYATMLLGDLGADVVKLEEPSGDDSRGWGPPFLAGESAYFLSVNRNKRSITLDLKNDAGLAAARRLARASDVVVENFRPGTAARLGLGPAELREEDPRLIYCSISGFGQASGRAGYDQIAQGTSGVMSLTGDPQGPPYRFGVPIGDISAGMFAAHAILAALYERERTGAGRTLEVSLEDSLIALLTYQAGRYFASGEAPLRDGNQHPIICPYGTYPTADGAINLGVGNDGHWLRFCEVTGAGDLAAEPAFATNSGRRAHRGEVNRGVEAVLAGWRTADILERLEAAGVPAGAVRTLDQVFEDPAIAARGMMVEVQHPVAGQITVTGSPWRIDGAPSPVRLPPPVLGQHSAEILAQLDGLG